MSSTRLSDAEIRVGSTVWVFDHNRRIYPPAPEGKGRLWSRGGPIYREHWVPVEITGENRVSWITYYGKFPKKPDAEGRYFIPNGSYTRFRVLLTEAEVDSDVWMHDHTHKIAERVRSCDVQTLRKVAELIGYDDGSRGGDVVEVAGEVRK